MILKICLIYILFENLNIFIRAETDQLLIRKLSTGYIRGRKLITVNGNEGYVYLGVPYAKPPLGELRFRLPEKKRAWEGILNTTEYRASCYWNSTIASYAPETFSMSEDCLHVNIYTSKYCLSQGGCPVIHYTHGGRFTFGTPIIFNLSVLVDNFAARDVIFVSVGYRQAQFAVLNLNYKLNLSLDMNAGFYDIIESLRWIQEEISVFGGNAKRVTAIGHSGGSLLVNFLLLTPIAKGLFQQAVAMSGVMGMNVFPLVKDRNQQVSRHIAISAGCALENSTEFWNNITAVNDVISCLRNKPAHEISSLQPLSEKAGLPQYQGVALDSGPNALFNRQTYKDLIKNIVEVPFITGTVSKETLETKFLVKDGVYVDQKLLLRYCEQIFITRVYNNYTNETIDLCAKEYNSSTRALDLGDDIGFFVPHFNLANRMFKTKQPVYLYQFEYSGIGDAYVKGPNLPQPVPEEMPAHSSEMIYIIGHHLGNLTEKDRKIQKIFSEFFANFAKYGNPSTSNYKWEKFNPDRTNYMVFDFNDQLKMPGMKNGYHKEAVEFYSGTIENLTGGVRTLGSETEGSIKIKNPKKSTPQSDYNNPNTSLGSYQETNWTLLFWITVSIGGILIIIHIVTLFVYKQKTRNDYELME